jgi:hypothetical protein
MENNPEQELSFLEEELMQYPIYPEYYEEAIEKLEKSLKEGGSNPEIKVILQYEICSDENTEEEETGTLVIKGPAEQIMPAVYNAFYISLIADWLQYFDEYTAHVKIVEDEEKEREKSKAEPVDITMLFPQKDAIKEDIIRAAEANEQKDLMDDIYDDLQYGFARILLNSSNDKITKRDEILKENMSIIIAKVDYLVTIFPPMLADEFNSGMKILKKSCGYKD